MGSIPFHVRQLIESTLSEDIGTGDITSETIVPSDLRATGEIFAKGECVLAGIDVAHEVFSLLDTQLDFEMIRPDGSTLHRGDAIARMYGKARSLLTGERVALNFLQRLSGIATLTSKYVEKIKGFNAKIIDTRKTTPGLRALEKYAVTVGGGTNHRFGLYDAVLIKDNHIDVIGSISLAVGSARAKIPHTMKIEVETRDLQEVEEALNARADIIMLDNMDCERMKQAVELIGGRALTEASGGITLSNLVQVAETGVDLISIGALTHSSQAVDISMDVRILGKS